MYCTLLYCSDVMYCTVMFCKYVDSDDLFREDFFNLKSAAAHERDDLGSS